MKVRNQLQDYRAIDRPVRLWLSNVEDETKRRTALVPKKREGKEAETKIMSSTEWFTCVMNEAKALAELIKDDDHIGSLIYTSLTQLKKTAGKEVGKRKRGVTTNPISENQRKTGVQQHVRRDALHRGKKKK